jgi:hypothetical protein
MGSGDRSGRPCFTVEVLVKKFHGSCELIIGVYINILGLNVLIRGERIVAEGAKALGAVGA